MKIAIKGHPFRGKEVIQILESLGGKNTEGLTGTYETFYYIDDKNEIGDDHKNNFPPTYKLYTLEEFEKEFPFKIGDEVTIVGLPYFPKVITQMTWDCGEILYSFEGLNNTWFGAKSLKKFEMKEERNITLTLDKAKEWYKKGGDLKQVALQAFSEKELNSLPRSWKEFCVKYSKTNDKEYFIDADSNIEQVSAIVPNHCRLMNADRNICPSKKSAEAHLAMIQLEQLRDCWRQGNIPQRYKYKIIKVGSEYTIVYGAYDAFLSFCDNQTAEEFLECFRDLIEEAGDLI